MGGDREESPLSSKTMLCGRRNVTCELIFETRSSRDHPLVDHRPENLLRFFPVLDGSLVEQIVDAHSIASIRELLDEFRSKAFL